MSEGSKQRILEGVVVSAKMQQTVVVAVERRTRHPLYERVIRSTKKYHAHNAGDQAQAGQRVRIQETRPLSKLKRWEVVAVLGE